MWKQAVILLAIATSNTLARSALPPSAFIFRSSPDAPERRVKDLADAKMISTDKRAQAPLHAADILAQGVYGPEDNNAVIPDSIVETTIIPTVNNEMDLTAERKELDVTVTEGVDATAYEIETTEPEVQHLKIEVIEETQESNLPLVNGMSFTSENGLLRKLTPPGHHDKVGDATTKVTTLDPWEEFCKEACAQGMAGDECNCAGHPIG